MKGVLTVGRQYIALGLVAIFFTSVLAASSAPASATDPDSFTATKRTSADWHIYPQLQVVGDKIYYVWEAGPEGVGTPQIWTATMNTDGTDWSATWRTTSADLKGTPQLQVVGDKIYYVWDEWDDNCVSQIWTATMNTDGTGWSANKRTTSTDGKYNPQLQVVSDKIYYVLYGWDDGSVSIWTATMNTDGTGWSATERITSTYNKWGPQLQVVGDKIYYVWNGYDDVGVQIWTATMNTDGTDWSTTKRTTSTYYKRNPQLQVVGDKIHYVWWEDDNNGKTQIWTSTMNTDGTDWSTTKRTTSTYHKRTPQLQVVSDKIYYVWDEDDSNGKTQIWTATMNTDGTDWSTTKRTTSTYDKFDQQLQVVGDKIHYVWDEDDDSSNSQIWTAVLIFDNMSPPAPTLISPPNGAFIRDNTPTFMWSAVSDPSGVTYTLQYSRGNDLQNINGDLDHDGDVDYDDYQIFRAAYGHSIGDPAYNPEADYDGTGTVGQVDYQIWRGYYWDFIETVTVIENLLDNTYTVPPENALLENTYYWRVRAVDGVGNRSDWSEVWQFTVDTTRPPAPTLISPPNGALINDSTPTFEWTARETSGVTYTLQYSTNPVWSIEDPNKPTVEHITENTYTMPDEDALVESTYYWRVRAVDGAGNRSDWSDIWQFTLDTVSPPRPIPLWPPNHWIFFDETPLFMWRGVTDPSGVTYQLQIARDQGFTDVFYDRPRISTIWHEVENALPTGRYYWHVRAIDGAGNQSNWSITRSFRIIVW